MLRFWESGSTRLSAYLSVADRTCHSHGSEAELRLLREFGLAHGRHPFHYQFSAGSKKISLRSELLHVPVSCGTVQVDWDAAGGRQADSVGIACHLCSLDVSSGSPAPIRSWDTTAFMFGVAWRMLSDCIIIVYCSGALRTCRSFLA